MEILPISGLEKISFTSTRQTQLKAVENAQLFVSAHSVELDSQAFSAIQAGLKFKLEVVDANRFKRCSPEDNLKLGREITSLRQNVMDFCSHNEINLKDFKESQVVSEPLEHLFFAIKLKATILALGNIRLIFNPLHRYIGQVPEEDLQDLFVDGYQGLFAAAARYNPQIRDGARFSTYAIAYIKGFMQRGLVDLETHNLPEHVYLACKNYRFAKNYLTMILGEDAPDSVVDAYMYLRNEKGVKKPTLTEVENQLNAINLTPHLKREFNRKTRKYKIFSRLISLVSLDDDIGIHFQNIDGESDYFQGNLAEWLELKGELGNETAEQPSDPRLRETLEEVLGVLTPRQREVIEYRFGLKDGMERTRREVGRICGVSSEDIRRIEIKALRVLRRTGNSNKLIGLIED